MVPDDPTDAFIASNHACHLCPTFGVNLNKEYRSAPGHSVWTCQSSHETRSKPPEQDGRGAMRHSDSDAIIDLSDVMQQCRAQEVRVATPLPLQPIMHVEQVSTIRHRQPSNQLEFIGTKEDAQSFVDHRTTARPEIGQTLPETVSDPSNVNEPIRVHHSHLRVA
jgi:hypothetical protein